MNFVCKKKGTTRSQLAITEENIILKYDETLVYVIDYTLTFKAAMHIHKNNYYL
jgi:hypothetical protein